MLKVEDIHVYYGDLQALEGVSLEVGEGRVVSVVGSNGAGKSTTLRTISGLLRPRKGAIEFAGKSIHRMAPSRIVELGVSHVPEGRQLFPTMSVEENLEMGAQFPDARKRLKETLDDVFALFPRLKERLDQKAGTLSGGEQQMAAIARGLMSKPVMLMLDEPSLGLSPLLVTTIFDTIRKINEQGMMVLLVEQNVYHALKLSHTAFVLENGRAVIRGSAEALLSDPEIKKAYLGI